MSVSEILPYPAKRFPYRPQVPYLKILPQKINVIWTKLPGWSPVLGLMVFLLSPRLRTATLDHSSVKIYILKKKHRRLQIGNSLIRKYST